MKDTYHSGYNVLMQVSKNRRHYVSIITIKSPKVGTKIPTFEGFPTFAISHTQVTFKKPMHETSFASIMRLQNFEKLEFISRVCIYLGSTQVVREAMSA